MVVGTPTAAAQPVSMPVSIAQFSEPAVTALFNEETDGYNNNGGTDDSYFSPTATGNVPTLRHSAGAVYAFCDGHAKWYHDGTLVYSATPAPATPRYQPYLPYPQRGRDKVDTKSRERIASSFLF